MRKIETNMINAINSGREFKQGNMKVENDGFNGWHVYLHGNRIAIVRETEVWINLCGWNNAILQGFVSANSNVSTKQGTITLRSRGEAQVIESRGDYKLIP